MGNGGKSPVRNGLSFPSPVVVEYGYHGVAMSLLQQNPSSGVDDAGRGEELTKGTSHIVWATIIAVIVVSAAIAAYVIIGQKPPAATGEASRVVAHMMHRETSGFDASGAVMPKEEFDQVLVFTHLKLHDQSKNPVFLRQILTNVTLEDGIHSSYAATPSDYERLFAAYPDLAALHGKPIALDATIEPGQDLEGDVVSSFRMTKAEFDARKGLDLSVSLRYLPDLKVTPTGSVTEQ
jgi:hypothetical protein